MTSLTNIEELFVLTVKSFELKTTEEDTKNIETLRGKTNQIFSHFITYFCVRLMPNCSLKLTMITWSGIHMTKFFNSIFGFSISENLLMS